MSATNASAPFCENRSSRLASRPTTRTLAPVASSFSAATIPVCPVAPVMTYIAPPHLHVFWLRLRPSELEYCRSPGVSNFVLFAKQDHAWMPLAQPDPTVAIGSVGRSVLYFGPTNAVPALHYRPIIPRRGAGVAEQG